MRNTIFSPKISSEKDFLCVAGTELVLCDLVLWDADLYCFHASWFGALK